MYSRDGNANNLSLASYSVGGGSYVISSNRLAVVGLAILETPCVRDLTIYSCFKKVVLAMQAYDLRMTPRCMHAHGVLEFTASEKRVRVCIIPAMAYALCR